MTILDAVYIDVKDRKPIVAMSAKSAFQAVLGVARSAVEGFSGSGEFADFEPATAAGP